MYTEFYILLGGLGLVGILTLIIFYIGKDYGEEETENNYFKEATKANQEAREKAKKVSEEQKALRDKPVDDDPDKLLYKD
jgi:hypothetical protein